MTVKELIEELEKYPEDLPVSCTHVSGENKLGGEVIRLEKSWFGRDEIWIETD